ncbi:MAG TPA: AI-2E family transporter [Gemmatimonadaceae bacterium]|nr:AI-2E family transporter [Gemmatimonadaceae bacterium]
MAVTSSPGSRTVVRFELAPRSVALVLAAVAGVWLAYQLWIVALILVIALILAGTFNPMIAWLERRGWRRFYALVALFVAIVVVIGGLLILTVPPLIAQLTQLVIDAPAMRTHLIAVLSERSATTPLAHAVESAELADTFASARTYLLSYSSQAARAIGYGATSVVLSFYLLADGKRTQGMLYAMVPRDYHMRVARILLNLERIVGGYMRGQFITSAAIGVFVFVLLAVCKVPNALSLSLLAAVVDVIPFIGGLLVIAPAVLSALSRGMPVAAVVLAALIVYMEFESRILLPRVYGKALRLSSTAVILALVAGGLLMGIMGALLALPITAGLLMILEELRVELPGDDSADPSAQARHAETEARYEELSAGATAPDAGEIAMNLAQAGEQTGQEEPA